MVGKPLSVNHIYILTLQSNKSKTQTITLIETTEINIHHENLNKTKPTNYVITLNSMQNCFVCKCLYRDL